MAAIKNSPAQLFFRGLGIGFVATQVLDVTSAYLYENLNPEDRKHEDRVRGGRQAYEEMVAKLAGRMDRQLSEDRIKYWGWKLHRALGLFGGVQYVLMRNMSPKASKGMGLGFGLGFFLLVDELLVPLLGATPGPTKFSWKTHLRGAVAHLAYGVAAELTARSFDEIAPYEEARGVARLEDHTRETPLVSAATISPAYT